MKTATSHRDSFAPRRFAGLAACLLCALSASSCLPFLRTTTMPLPVEVLADPPDATCSVVLLPGLWDRPDDFERRGFADELEARGLRLRVLAADAHVGYYRQRSIPGQLRQVVGAERAEGRTVWLAGNSLGGVGALIHLRHARPGDDVAGVLLMAPYLGEDATLAEIRAAGGPLAWAPPGSDPSVQGPAVEPEAGDRELDREEYARETWRWLAAWHRRGGETPQIWLGWGEDDDFAAAAELAAELVPAGRAQAAPGGHDWQAWRRNWRDFLDAGALEECRGP